VICGAQLEPCRRSHAYPESLGIATAIADLDRAAGGHRVEGSLDGGLGRGHLLDRCEPWIDRIFAIVFAASEIRARRVVVRDQRSSGRRFGKSDPSQYGIDGDGARGRLVRPALAKIGEVAYM
jgi:hypothetical protein